MSPYDWQESIGQRAQYIESRLSSGVPAVAVSRPDGILLVSWRRQAPKTFEIYDRLAMAALGLQSDVEAIRTAAVEFCHKEGFQRSSDDVTLKRTATALSRAVKQAFNDFRVAPVVAIALLAELGETQDRDRFAVLEFDGDFHELAGPAVLAAHDEFVKELLARLPEPVDSLEDHARALGEAILRDPEDAILEAAFLDRSNQTERKFRLILGSDEER